MKSHSFYVIAMIGLCFLWSLSGIVTRHLEKAKTWEVTFWRSFFTILAMLAILAIQKRGAMWRAMFSIGTPGAISSVMWCGMFTCFMLALTFTSTANTMVVSCLYPIFAALLGWAVLGVKPLPRMWFAILATVAGLGFMVWEGVGSGMLGMTVALGVPLCAAINVVTLKKFGTTVDLIPAVMFGAVLSSLITLPFALPFQATSWDLASLAFLGTFQLAIPCALLVVVGRHLPPAEVALLSLLEVVFAPIWTWLWAAETPSRATLIGGGIALAAITINELLALRSAPNAQA